MVPNFCVKLKPDKFHTVAHFRKKFCSRLVSILCIWKKKEKKNPLIVSNCKEMLYILSKTLYVQSVREWRLASWYICNPGMPRVTSATRQLRETLWNLSEHPLHINTKCSFLPISPGTCVRGLKPSQALVNPTVLEPFLHTHVFIFLSFSALTTFFKLGGTPIFFFPCKKEKKEIKSFSVIEIHDKL